MDLDKPEPEFQPIHLTKQQVVSVHNNHLEMNALRKLLDDSLESLQGKMKKNMMDKSKIWDSILAGVDIPMHQRNRLVLDIDKGVVYMEPASPNQDLRDFLKSQ
jgi:hypothetical protein